MILQEPIREVHSIPLWLLREYLEELGGKAETETRIAGEEWLAELTKLPPRAIGSLRVGQVEVAFSGEAGTIKALQKRFMMKTMRAGA